MFMIHRFHHRVIVMLMLGAAALCFAFHGKSDAADASHQVPEGMVVVPGGKFIMGTSDEQRERLASEYKLNPDLFGMQTYREVDLPTFFIDRHEVTVGQYRAFVEETGHRPPLTWQLNSWYLEERREQWPVVGVDYDDAAAYAKWAGKRLSTEEEWEKAARGADGRLWPWGNEWAPDVIAREPHQNQGAPGPWPVGLNHRDRSVYGALNMAGNVPEWVDGKLEPGFEYTAIVKGGGFLFDSPEQFICAAGVGHPRGNGSLATSIMFNNPYIGFRCAMDVPEGFEPDPSGAVEPPYQGPIDILRAGRRAPDLSSYRREKIKILPVANASYLASGNPKPRKWPQNLSGEGIKAKMTPWHLEVSVPYLPGDQFGILLENHWQHNSPIEEIHFNKDFTRVELKTGVPEWNLESRITLEGGLDHVDVTYENTNTGDTVIPGSQEMCLSALGAPNFRDHDGARTFLSTEDGLKSMSQIWHYVNDRIYCQNHMLPSKPPAGTEGPAITGPLIATTSRDGQWLVSPLSLTPAPNRLFNNREYSCLHCTPDSSVEPGETKVMIQRIYFLHGTLDDLSVRYESDLAAIAGPSSIGEQAENPGIKTVGVEGERYTALVPDTLDLARHAEFALNALVLGHYPEFDYEPKQSNRVTGDFFLGTKWIESFPMMRVMCGSDLGLDVEMKMMESYLARIEADGLLHCPPDNPVRRGGRGYEQAEEPYTSPYADGRMVLAMMAWGQRDGDPAWTERMRAMAEGLKRIPIYKDDYAYYPDGGVAFDFSYLRNSGYKNTAEPASEHAGAEGTVKFYQSNQMRALARWAALSGDRESLQVAGKIANYLLKPQFWEKGYPEEVIGRQRGQWSGHYHGNTAVLMGLLRYAIIARDRQLMELVRASYEYSRNFGIARIGWFPTHSGHDTPPKVVCETCRTADMVALAVELSTEGLGDYWDDVDGYVRNALVEQQFTDMDRLKALVAAKDPDPSWMLGTFGCGGLSVMDDYTIACCTGNGAPAMYFAWEGIVRAEDGVAQVNLLLNRASPWLDVNSYLPYEGKVTLHNKTARRVSVRVPNWVDKLMVECRLNGPAGPDRLAGQLPDRG